MMSDTGTHKDTIGPTPLGRTAEEVINELVRRGFECSDHGDHVTLERDGLRVVTPGRGRDLPARVAQMVEFALEPHLGVSWLSQPRARTDRRRIGTLLASDIGAIRVLDAIIVQQSPDEPWCAVLADEFAVIGYGAGREEALRDLKRAAALWLEVDTTNVVLVTPTVI
jgi:predicted RNase H-like HicB family nuclease